MWPIYILGALCLFGLWEVVSELTQIRVALERDGDDELRRKLVAIEMALDRLNETADDISNHTDNIQPRHQSWNIES